MLEGRKGEDETATEGARGAAKKEERGDAFGGDDSKTDGLLSSLSLSLFPLSLSLSLSLSLRARARAFRERDAERREKEKELLLRGESGRRKKMQ
jgi:hypothetical protein